MDEEASGAPRNPRMGAFLDLGAVADAFLPLKTLGEEFSGGP